MYARMFDEKESFIKTTLTDGKPSHHVSFFTKRNFENNLSFDKTK